ncbi:uncharacterized protein LOC122307132 [Carya illinoinensis]|uniref:uncharacterized protein LOC122307132 n=1 Tax=Carya illinoinensis TaxID=32201 RepID=UPI001C71D760|nr:uncharacterized protein LOC122307132 [Carya illinoinensis]
MEGTIGATKRVLVGTMLLLAVVVVQAQEVSPSYPTLPKPENFLSCAKKCVPACSLKIIEGPIQYSICLAQCLLQCKHSHDQNEVVYDCTEKCAISKATIFKPESYEKVESYVDSCYEGCWNKNTVGRGL